jgi:predicted AAA+ superfamily ATPase
MNDELKPLLARAESLLARVEALFPPVEPDPDWSSITAARWRKRNGRGFLQSVRHPHAIALDDLVAIDAQKDAIDRNNRRHLLPEYFAENLETRHVGEEVHPGESVEEKISLSERFGLWVSFYPFVQDDYLAAVDRWLAHFGVAEPSTAGDAEARMREALQFALQRGSRSGRVAWQFARHWAGGLGLQASGT